jgi:hypothetical protein
MNFSELPPSKHWAALKYRGEKFAEVWFKPADEPFGLLFRIPRESFQVPGVAPLLNAENLLKAVGIAAGEVESWGHDNASGSDPNETGLGLGQPLPPPPDEVSHLELTVSLKQPAEAAATDSPEESGDATGEPDDSAVHWHDLEARWRAILGVEATIDTLRLRMEALQAEMETAAKKTLTTEERLHALNRDVTAWNKAKSRVHYAVPKIKEFVHRATWVVGQPERKQLNELDELFEYHHAHTEAPFPYREKLPEQLENLLKDRQILHAHGTTIFHECKGIASDIEKALRMLQSNAARNLQQKRRAAQAKGKFFKDIRRLSGAD